MTIGGPGLRTRAWGRIPAKAVGPQLRLRGQKCASRQKNLERRRIAFFLAALPLAASRENAFAYDGSTSGGSLYYRARYYDAVLKRFLAEDPIGLLGGANVYAYVYGAPTAYGDSLGLLSAADLPLFPQGAVDFGGGFGDVLTFGISKHIRNAMGVGSVDVCSASYSAGEIAGIVASIATGFAGGTKAIANATNKAATGISWSNFSHSLFADSYLKKVGSPLAKWLNQTGNRLNGDFITNGLHNLIDPVANRVGKSLAKRAANPPFPKWRQNVNRVPYTPGASAYGAGSYGLNQLTNCCD